MRNVMHSGLVTTDAPVLIVNDVPATRAVTAKPPTKVARVELHVTASAVPMVSSGVNPISLFAVTADVFTTMDEVVAAITTRPMLLAPHVAGLEADAQLVVVWYDGAFTGSCDAKAGHVVGELQPKLAEPLVVPLNNTLMEEPLTDPRINCDALVLKLVDENPLDVPVVLWFNWLGIVTVPVKVGDANGAAPVTCATE
jgi:hypothetical protein